MKKYVKKIDHKRYLQSLFFVEVPCIFDIYCKSLITINNVFEFFFRFSFID